MLHEGTSKQLLKVAKTAFTIYVRLSKTLVAIDIKSFLRHLEYSDYEEYYEYDYSKEMNSIILESVKYTK